MSAPPTATNRFGLPSRPTAAPEPGFDALDMLRDPDDATEIAHALQSSPTPPSNTELIGTIEEGGDATSSTNTTASQGEVSRELEAAGRAAAKPRPQTDLIIRHMLINPTATVKQVAQHFGVSSGWMYTLTNSDMFKVRYNALLKELDVEHLLPTLHQRIVGMAHKSLDRLDSQVETASPELTLEIYKAMAKTVAPPPHVGAGPVTVNNNNQVSLTIDARSASITAARRNMLEQARQQLTING